MSQQHKWGQWLHSILDFAMYLCILYISTDISMSTSCASWSCSCTSHDGHTFPKRALLIREPDCLVGPCTDIFCTTRRYPAFVMKMEGCVNLRRIWTLHSWPLHNCTPEQQSGGGSVLPTAKAGRLAADRLRKKHHGEYWRTRSAVAEPPLLPGVTPFVRDPASVYWNT